MKGFDSITGDMRNRSGVVMSDLAPGASAYTSGATVNLPLTVNPTLAQQWTILGFSVQARLVFVGGATVPGVYGRLGDLWVGVTRNEPSPPPLTSKAVLPSDLSSFAKIWAGDTDPIRVVSNFNSTDPAQPATLVVHSEMLPVPLTAHPGDKVGITAILLPSLIGTNSGPATLYVWQMFYSVLYTLEFVNHKH